MEENELNKEERKTNKEAFRKNQKSKYIRVSLWVALSVLAVWLAGFFVQGYFCIKSEGVFTTLSTLFSALAFAGVIVTIIMQRDELELQRDEMELTRDEFVKQNKTLSRQRFENTFFELLRRQVDIRNEIQMKEPKPIAEGLDSFKLIYERLEKGIFDRRKQIFYNRDPKAIYMNQELPAFAEAVNKITIDFLIVKEDFKKIIQPHSHELLHYYNHLSVVIEFVSSTHADVSKPRYINFLKSEMSEYEILCLFYFGLSDYGYRDFKSLLDTTNLFTSVNRDKLIDRDHADLYKKNQ